MKLEEIYKASNDWNDRLSAIQQLEPYKDESVSGRDEYLGDRKIRDTQVGKRVDKTLANGNTQKVNRIALNFQKVVTRTAAAMLLGEQPRIQTQSQADISELMGAWEDSRMHFHLLKACEKAKSMHKSAILFRKVKPEGGEERIVPTVIDPSLGKLIPIWSEWETLDAFVYITKIEEDGKEKTLNYIYNKTGLDLVVQIDDKYEVQQSSHGFDRIPVVYFEEEEVEWEDVKSSIDRYEMRYSRLADTNDYFGSPMLKATGDIDNVPEKDEDGQVFLLDIIETENGQVVQSDLDVLAWDSQIESTKLELEAGRKHIYDLSMTPDLSFDNVKGIGSISGTALGMMFLQSRMKAAFSWPSYRVAIQRCLNIFRANYGGNSFDSEVFIVRRGDITPDNLQEMVSLLGEAAFNKPIMSQRTAVEVNPLVADPAEEMNRLEEEDTAGLGETLNLD